MCRRSCTRSASSSSWSVPCCGSWAPPVAPLGDAATTGDRRVSTARTADLWWKNAIVYCLDVETFLDSDGDGSGDLAGLTERVDYLAGIGVTCVWLMPFYASPNRDDGYDVTDFYSVDERLGSLGDFVVFVRTAKDRGLRVLIDLVVNHTSDQHPWFRAARESRESPYRDYYVWRDQPSEEPAAKVVFPDAEDSIWTFDEVAGQHYLHHFYSHQPDLNIASPAVREEIAKIAGFWLQLGVDGFRVDAVPFLLETGGLPGEVDLDPHGLLKDLRAFISRRRGDAVLLGEVNLPLDQLPAYFGDGQADEIQLLFDFPVMQGAGSRYRAGHGRCCSGARRRRAVGDGVEPGQGAVRRARRDQARPRPLLPHRRRALAAGHGRSAGAAAALPQWRRRLVVLPEAHPRHRSGVAAHHDREHAQRHRVAGAGDRGPGPRRVGGEPRLPGLPRLALHRRPSRRRRRAAPGPRPPARDRLRRDPGSRARAAGTAG